MVTVVCFIHHPDSLLPSIHINYSSSSTGITTSVKCLSTPYTAFLGTDAAINLIKLETFKALSAIIRSFIFTLPPDLNIHRNSGRNVFLQLQVYLTLIFT